MSVLGKIVNAEARPDHAVRVIWDDGATAVISLDKLIRTRRPLAPLLDAEEFANVRVSADGWSLEWPSGIDFGASQLRVWADQTFNEKVGA